MRHELNRLSQITMGLTNTYLHELIVIMLRLFLNYGFITLSVKITGLTLKLKYFLQLHYRCVFLSVETTYIANLQA